MADPTAPTTGYGCNIQRSGSPGSYRYAIALDWAKRPVNFVSWGDAARFCNWLHNGQPTGAQDVTTTEDGSYFLNGATTDAALLAVVRKPDATWVIPSEDEWYKSAYHHNNGATSNYFDYPTASDSDPSNVLGVLSDPGNNATFYYSGYTIGSPFFRTEVGAHEDSESPYRTFDQGGNIWELNETVLNGSYRGARGGSFFNGRDELRAEGRFNGIPTAEGQGVGFRVAKVQLDCSTLLGDSGIFAPRMMGPDSAVPWEDLCPDLDEDRDVDLYDFALFQSLFNGAH